MAASELSAPTPPAAWPGSSSNGDADRAAARGILSCALALVVVTMLAALVALLDPGALTARGELPSPIASSIVPVGQPHAVPHPALAAIVSILVTNLRVLAAPFILAGFRFPSGRRARLLGDLIVGGILAGNALRVGLALGRWQGRLIPFVPQLPLEYLAASTAATVWLDARGRGAERPDPRTIASYAALTMLLVAAAAIVEVLATPHAR